MDSLEQAITRLDLDAIRSMRNSLALDRDAMNAHIHLLSESIIRSLIAKGMRREALNLESSVEEAKMFYNAVLAAGKRTTPNFSIASLDLSPWHVFDLNIHFFGEGRLLPRLEYLDGRPIDQPRNAHEQARLFAILVVLWALPQRGHTEGQNAFMVPHDGMTPLMHGIRHYFNQEKLRVLFTRGGFSSAEWESGAVMSLLSRGHIEELVKNLLFFYRQDILARVNRPVGDDKDNTVLMNLCQDFHSTFYLSQDVKILVENLGADPTRVNRDGMKASDILYQRWLGTHEAEYEGRISGEIQRIIAYLRDKESETATSELESRRIMDDRDPKRRLAAA